MCKLFQLNFMIKKKSNLWVYYIFKKKIKLLVILRISSFYKDIFYSFFIKFFLNKWFNLQEL